MAKRPSSVHLLPRTADEAIAGAIDAAMVSRHMTQGGALDALNEQLRAMKLAPISRSSWHRFLGEIEESGTPARWRRRSGTGDSVVISRARYTELLEAEAAFLRHKLSR
ncbi:MAG: DUF3486 family protein [Notoacmeibacter sp.]|nr:DUF3486 family protein [Notoacmeibacter sp.]